ncbi:WD repeat-containing protein 73 isoform X1 [Protopterus annectens]|uniref:WD repeat-containing protein 73 isoform X1 n=1 Tax=Protopterus annectens TaxID=7888 RepID=UPI001CF9D96D|nr:WD repeat-containing protein 73 isoform X1 [Protopterus annectens]
MAEDASSGDEFDDWFIESIKLYNDLHIYELQHATQVIEWTDEKNVCVAGCEFLKKNEILQLSLPQKLYNKDSQGLCPERDFKVEHGGFSERPVYSLRHIQGTSLLVTSGPPDNSLQLWKIGAEDTDVIGLIGSIENRVMENIWSRISVSKMMSSRVLHGSRVNNIQVTDIESKMELYKLDSDIIHVVSNLELLDSNLFLICSMHGGLWLADVRQHPGLIANATTNQQTSTEHWCMGINSFKIGDGFASCKIATLSSERRIMVKDMRDLKKTLSQAKVSFPRQSLQNSFLCVTWSPVVEELLAVSGFDGTVHVYDTSSWNAAEKEVQPLFIHKGHSFSDRGDEAEIPLVTTHTWCPWKPRTILSAATDGSFHVWDWADFHTS